jgi:hypothetical protein
LQAYLIAFVIAATPLSKRFKIHKTFYKGNYKILIVWGFIGILFLIKVFLNGNFLFRTQDVR